MTRYDYEGYPFVYDGQTVYRGGLPLPVVLSSGGGVGVLTGDYRYKAVYKSVSKTRDIFESQPSLASAVISPTSNQVVLQLFNPRQQTPAWFFTAAVMGAASQTVPIATIDTGYAAKPGDTVLVVDTTPSPRIWVRRVLTGIDLITPKIEVNLPIKTAAGAVLLGYPADGINDRIALFNGATTNANTLTVIVNHQIEVGDFVTFWETNSSAYVTRNVTAIAATTVTVDGGVVSVDDATTDIDTMSQCLTIEVYRTKAGGNLFYFLKSLPVRAYSDTFITYNDNTPDANLGAELIEPPIGKERNLPPRCGVGVLHQGIMAYGAISKQNNTFAFSSVEGGYEAVPLASNYADIPASQPGQMTALYSETDDNLLIFKDKAAYQANGDLDGNAFTLTTIKEGDYGISSQGSLARVSGVLRGVGQLGLIATVNGQIGEGTEDKISPAVRNDFSRNIPKTRAVNDSSNSLYRIHIPPSAYATYTNIRRGFAWNYATGLWTDFTLTEGIDADNGLTVHNNRLYFCNRSTYVPTTGPAGCSFVETDYSLLANADVSTSWLYYDAGNAQTSTYTTEWLTLDEPSLDKEFLRVKIYRIIPDYEQDEFPSALTLAVTIYKNFYDIVAKSSHTVTFSGFGDYEKSIYLPSDKARSIKVSISATTIGQPMYLTGLELIVSEPVRKAEFVRDRSSSV